MTQSERATPEMIAAAWAAWKVRHKGSIGPGPGFVEAINAALAVRSPGLEPLLREAMEVVNRHLICLECGSAHVTLVSGQGLRATCLDCGRSGGNHEFRQHGMQPPAGETIRATQDGGMEAAPVTGQSPVGAVSTDLTDEDRIAYWKGAYERMAARNVSLVDALTNAILVLDDLATGQGIAIPIEQVIRELNDVVNTGGAS